MAESSSQLTPFIRFITVEILSQSWSDILMKFILCIIKQQIGLKQIPIRVIAKSTQKEEEDDQHDLMYHI